MHLCFQFNKCVSYEYEDWLEKRLVFIDALKAAGTRPVWTHLNTNNMNVFNAGARTYIVSRPARIDCCKSSLPLLEMLLPKPGQARSFCLHHNITFSCVCRCINSNACFIYEKSVEIQNSCIDLLWVCLFSVSNITSKSSQNCWYATRKRVYCKYCSFFSVVVAIRFALVWLLIVWRGFLKLVGPK